MIDILTFTGQLNIMKTQPIGNELLENKLYRRKYPEALSNSNLNYVYAKQGKSYKYHIWSLQNLLESNCQLYKLDDCITSDNFHVITNNLSRIAISIQVIRHK